MKADHTTISTWITTQGTTTSVANPPADGTTAFGDIKTFATSH